VNFAVWALRLLPFPWCHQGSTPSMLKKLTMEVHVLAFSVSKVFPPLCNLFDKGWLSYVSGWGLIPRDPSTPAHPIPQALEFSLRFINCIIQSLLFFQKLHIPHKLSNLHHGMIQVKSPYLNFSPIFIHCHHLNFFQSSRDLSSVEIFNIMSNCFSSLAWLLVIVGFGSLLKVLAMVEWGR
jgi:hypothetical protein